MLSMHYVGLDIHKKSITYCVRESDGTILHEGSVAATRPALDLWITGLPTPWIAGMEATMFTGWVYDHLTERDAVVKIAHPAMLKAITASKKKNDRVDAQKFRISSGATIFRNVILHPARSATAGAYFDTGIFWSVRTHKRRIVSAAC